MIAALVQGAAIAGLRPILQRPHLDTGHRMTLPDVSAIFVDGIRGNTGRFVEAYVAEGIPSYIVELPRLRAVCGPDRNEYSDTYGVYQDSLAHLPLRIGNRVVVEGVLEDTQPRFLLLCGQKPNDTSHGMDARAMAQWTREMVTLIKMQYGLPVVYRPHPRDVMPIPEDMYGADDVSLPTVPLRMVLGSAVAVVSYNSTCGIDAIDAGVPALYAAAPDKVSYRDYAQRVGQRIEPLTMSERRTFLLRCGATQWTMEQMMDGTMMRCLINGDALPEPELVEPELKPKKVDKPLTGNARNRSMSREVIADGR